MSRGEYEEADGPGRVPALRHAVLLPEGALLLHSEDVLDVNRGSPSS